MSVSHQTKGSETKSICTLDQHNLTVNQLENLDRFITNLMIETFFKKEALRPFVTGEWEKTQAISEMSSLRERDFLH